MKRLLMLSLALLLGLSACNVPTEPSTSIAPELQTAAAQTVQAVLTPLNSPTAAPSATQGQPADSPTGATLTSAATITSTPTITPTYSVPMITFNESTNCRTGPGQNYEVIFTFLPGGKAEIVGAYPQDGYWIVQLPDGGGTCWAWGGYATTTGSTWVLTPSTPPATRTPTPPEAPTNVSVYYSCAANNEITVTLGWRDNSDGEEGYRVLRNGEVVAQLPPNITSYVDTFLGDVTKKYTYIIEVFGGGLVSRSNPNQYSTFSCQ